MSEIIRKCAWCDWQGTTKEAAQAHRATHADLTALRQAEAAQADRDRRVLQAALREQEADRRERVERERVQADLAAARVKAERAAARRIDLKRRRENPMCDADYDDVVSTYQIHGRSNHDAGVALAERIDRSTDSTFMLLAQVAHLDPATPNTGLNDVQGGIIAAWERRTR